MAKNLNILRHQFNLLYFKGGSVLLFGNVTGSTEVVVPCHRILLLQKHCLTRANAA